MKNPIVLLGSTGSIGTQTLQVARAHNIEVVGLSAHANAELLERQRQEFGVAVGNVCLSSVNPARLCELAAIPDCTVVNAIVGAAGLPPTLAAIRAGNTVALANKESLVAGGEEVMRESRERGVPVIPVDSEHSAIWQCLQMGGGSPHTSLVSSRGRIRKVFLTASGGAFLGYTKAQLREVTREQAVRNPNWSMGAKISVDSATLMNKGLELIEAMYLFDLDESQIEVVIHPQSIVHSAVEFADGAVIAQMSVPDMRLPIQYALTYPERFPCAVKPLSLIESGKLTFSAPDVDTFPCLALAREAARLGGDAPRRLNQANEEAVTAFLGGEIAFCEIPDYIIRSTKLCL